jgi:putative DNA primase/helicase
MGPGTASLWVEEGKRLAHSKTLRNLEFLARSDPRHAATVELWDRDPFMLGAGTKVADLRTGQVRPQWREDYILRSTSVEPAPPGTPTPLWDKFLDELTGYDESLKVYLMRLAGYWCTGSIKEQIVAFIVGEGGTGKGTFLHAIANILGDYHIELKTDLITTLKPGFRDNSAEYWFAQLFRKRLATMEETEKGSKWDERTIKKLSGGDKIPARHPGGRPFSFPPVLQARDLR